MPNNNNTTAQNQNNSANSDNGAEVSSLHYPRTGKRGVPQQFPRRLYEMLQSETKLIEASADHPKIIYWAKSGKAFRIADVAEFSATILPKYFRTKKFSSFQRNLNLYGFAKVRRGPETDMYAHPSFGRDQADSLSKLRKLSSTASRRRCARESPSVVAGNKENKHAQSLSRSSRSVSPSPSTLMLSSNFHVPIARRAPTSSTITTGLSYSSPKQSPMWAPIHQVPPSPDTSLTTTKTNHRQARAPAPPAKSQYVGRGRLDLLALAMEQAAAM